MNKKLAFAVLLVTALGWSFPVLAKLECREDGIYFVNSNIERRLTSAQLNDQRVYCEKNVPLPSEPKYIDDIEKDKFYCDADSGEIFINDGVFRDTNITIPGASCMCVKKFVGRLEIVDRALYSYDSCKVISLDDAAAIEAFRKEQEEATGKKPFCSIPEDIAGFRQGYTKVCWFCEPFDKVLSNMGTVAKTTFDALQPTLMSLMTILFGIWMAYHIFIFLAGNLPAGPQKTDTYQKLIAGFFRLMVAAILLKAGIDTMWELTVNYISSVGIAIAHAIVASVEPDIDPLQEGTGFDFIQANLMSVLMAFNAAIMGMIANGVILVKHAFASGMLPCVIPTFDPLVGGLVLILFGMALLLRVPLRLVDAIFQLFVIAVLLPILVVAWVFPYGKNYAKKGLDMLIGVLGMFITMAVMIAIVTVILKELAGGAEKISTAKDLADAFSWNSVKEGMLGLLTWVGTLWFCYVGFGSVTDYAETLFGAPKQNIGKGVTDLAEKGLKAAGTTAAHGAAGAGVLAGRGAWMGAKGAGGLAVRGVRSLAGWAQNRRGGPGAANAPNPTPGPSLAPTPAMRSMLNSLNNAAAAKKSQIPQKALPAHAQSGTPQSSSQPSPSPLGPGTPPTPQLSLPEHASGSPPSSPQTPLGGNPQTGTQQSDHMPEATKTQPGSTSSNSGGGQGSGNAQN